MENYESRISTSFEVRSEDDGVAVVEGYAAVFNEDAVIEPLHLNWSTVIFRKRRTKNDKQASKARRDCVEVTAS